MIMFYPPMHYPRGLDTMEGYIDIGFHIKTNIDYLSIISSPTLRTMLFFNREAM
jgi:hypothetical protein